VTGRDQIGPYRLLEKIGEGGMGEVWVAEQKEPVRRRVALKVIKRGMDSDQIVARFEAERQALAMMDHPAIAKVFDAGQTPNGRPYFVMEHVDGVAITEHCDRHKLSTRERLELFARVCEGVQHAHQKAVIHRDIKPSNVLVTVKDGKAEPKIIDFGVAKATAHRLTEKTIYTELGVLIGTPEYMSPEQAEMTGQDVDTRTDVYSLGVLLYELLTGALPFDSRELRAAGFDEIRRQIREVDPPKPSTRLGSLPGDRSTLAANNRRSETRTLTRQIRGDLDWITMRALEKDRTRRYGSASDLALDLGRYLRDEPVLAGPPSDIYRAKKFVKRNKVGVGVAALLAVVLVAFGLVTTMQSRRIAREAAKAEQVSEFLVELFEVSDPSEARGNAITAREVLAKGAERIEAELSDQPEVQARLMSTIGEVHAKLGLREQSRPLLERAVQRYTEALGSEHRATLQTRSLLGSLDRLLARLDDSQTQLETVLEIQQRRFGQEDPDTLDTRRRLAWVHHDRHDYELLEPIHRSILEARRRLLGEEHSDTLVSMSDLADAYKHECREQSPAELDPGCHDEARKLLLTVLDGRRRALGGDHPETLSTVADLVELDVFDKKFDQAEQRYVELLEARRAVYGERHPNTLDIMHNLVNVYQKSGQLEEAERLLSEVVAMRREVQGDRHPDTLQAIRYLAGLNTRMGRYEVAGSLLREVVPALRETLGPSHLQTRTALSTLAEWNAAQGRHADSAEAWRELAEGNRKAFGIGEAPTIYAMRQRAMSLERAGRKAEAETTFREALGISREHLGEGHFQSLETLTRLGNLLLDQGRLDDAKATYAECLESARPLPGARSAFAICAYLMAWTNAAQGKDGEPLDWLREAAEAGFDQQDPATNPAFAAFIGDPVFEGLAASIRTNASGN